MGTSIGGVPDGKEVDMLVRDFYRDIYLPRCKERLRTVTQASYECTWRLYIEPHMGDMELADITPRFLDGWIKDAGVHATVWRTTKAMLRVAYKYELIDRDPCDRVLNPPPKGKPNPPTLSRYEMEQLMDGFVSHALYANVCCSCHLGVRREESFGLEWEDFDWDANTVTIQRGVQYVWGEEQVVPPKTKLSRRTLPIPPELKARIYHLRGEGRLMGTMNAMQAANRYRYHCQTRGLKFVPMSNLRTSWATFMVNSGYPITLISRWMGHADVETTVRWYTKPREEDLVEIADAWGGSPRPSNVAAIPETCDEIAIVPDAVEVPEVVVEDVAPEEPEPHRPRHMRSDAKPRRAQTRKPRGPRVVVEC